MLGLYNHHVSPAAFNTQTSIAASITAINAAAGGAGAAGPQSSLLTNVTKGLNDGLAAAASLQVST